MHNNTVRTHMIKIITKQKKETMASQYVVCLEASNIFYKLNSCYWILYKHSEPKIANHPLYWDDDCCVTKKRKEDKKSWCKKKNVVFLYKLLSSPSYTISILSRAKNNLSSDTQCMPQLLTLSCSGYAGRLSNLLKSTVWFWLPYL